MISQWRHPDPIIQMRLLGYSIDRIAERNRCSLSKVVRVLKHYWEVSVETS